MVYCQSEQNIVMRKIAACIVLSLTSAVWILFIRIELLGGRNDNGPSSSLSSLSSFASSSSSSSSSLQSYPENMCSAQYIVQDAYDRAYRRIVERCRPGMSYVDGCIANGALDDQSPWWLEGLFRESYRTGNEHELHPYLLSYHKIWFDDPKLRVCQLEKVASTEWSVIFSKFHHQPLADLRQHQPRVVNTTTVLPPNPITGWSNNTDGAPHAVFLRDPLERFLSAYLDKCERWNNRGRHCTPFNPDSKDYFVSDVQPTKFTNIRRESPFYSNYTQKAFASYVYTFALQWDVHFVPQALFCDGLFRTLSDYAFVGRMQEEFFLQDLKRLLDQFIPPNTKLATLFRNQFNFNLSATNFREELERQQLSNHKKFPTKPTGSTQKLRKYYDADLVRQVLQYYAIDYATLNLPIPVWVQEILDADCHQKYGPHDAAGEAVKQQK